MEKVIDTQFENWSKLTEFKDELINLTDTEKKNRFSNLISFGTGGMRAIMGAGLNRMNIYTVRLATTGLAKQIIQDELPKKVVISYDTRHNSQRFAKEAAQTLLYYGIKTYLFIEPRPTPMLSYAVRYYEASAGIMITASHNPKEYNGYKLYGQDGGQLTPEAVNDVRRVMEENITNLTELPISNEKPAYILEELEIAYHQELRTLQKLNSKKDLSIVYTPLHGTGLLPIQKGLADSGFNKVYIEPNQAVLDGDFPTVDLPNPEEVSAFKLAEELGLNKQADILIATDPDADRLGVAVLHNEDYHYLTGNQLGALLLHYKLTLLQDNHALPNNGVAIKTIVTSELGRKIAENFNIEMEDTLTGFKYISEKIEHYNETDEKTFVFGYEESYGYLLEDFARDKDAIQSAIAVSEMAQLYKNKQETLIDALESLYHAYGYHQEKLISIELDPIEGSKEVDYLMNMFTSPTDEIISSLAIESIENYLTSERRFIAGGISKLTLPQENVIKYHLNNAAWVCFRPSGTEPKMKVYLGVCADNEDSANDQLNTLETKIKTLI